MTFQYDTTPKPAGRGDFFCRPDAESLASRLRERQLSSILLHAGKNYLLFKMNIVAFA